MQAKTVHVSISEIKEMLDAVFIKAVNSYYELKEITVDEILKTYIKNFDEKTNIELTVPETSDQKFNKNPTFVSLGANSSNQISPSTTFVSCGTDPSSLYNSIVLPTSAYYNSIGLITNNQVNS
jgi:hypothetical protein